MLAEQILLYNISGTQLCPIIPDPYKMIFIGLMVGLFLGINLGVFLMIWYDQHKVQPYCEEDDTE